MQSLKSSFVKRLSLKQNIFIFIVLMLSLIAFSAVTFAKEYEISNYDVRVELTEKGDFIVEEEITFHFLEGEFFYAYREIEGDLFNTIEFVNVEGVDTAVTDFEVDGGDDLNVTWYYNQNGKKNTFIFRYRGMAGLYSRGERNVIDWSTAVAGWEVPIRDLDISIFLPWQMEDLEIRNTVDLDFENGREVRFHNDWLEADENYKVYISFPEMVDMSLYSNRWQTIDIVWFFALLFAGLVFTIVDILSKEKVTADKGDRTIEDLKMYEKFVIFNNAFDTKKGITAQVFRLAKEGKMRLVSSVKKGILGTKNAEVSVEIINTENLCETEREIVDGIKKHDNLKDFSQDYKWFSSMDKKIKDSMRELGLISKEAEHKQKRILLSCLVFFIPSLAAFIVGAISNSAIILGAATALLLIGIGRLIKGLMITVLTSESLYLKEKIAEQIEDRKDRLDELIKNEEYTEALVYFFSELDYIIIQKHFSSNTMYQYKRAFKKAENIELPEWLEIDLSGLDSTLDALDLVEIIDYVLMSTVVIAASTGTTSTGVAGGAGGGGGSGAG
ncbi:MAG: DUF2207 domain-containing protein [Halanaerobiales bacterium]